MALSLVCQECHAQLRSVEEAQAHNETTGHTNFAESTEALLNLVCQTCGKPCRSHTERDLHTKRTGHADFADQTAAAGPIDSEAQMAAAAAAARLPSTGASEASASSVAPSADVAELVPPCVDTALRQQLEDMGFSANKATRALHFSGNAGLEQALAWMEAHEGEAGLDEPLLVPQEKAKPKLSPEEARKAAEDLIRRTRERKEREEREAERLREQERVRAGKELLAAQRLEAELQLKRNIEARQREKEEVARAKERIRIKLAEDRAERRRKLGLPAELTPEEEAAERAKAAAKEAAARKPLVPPKPVGQAAALREALVQARKQAGGEDGRFTAAAQTLLKYVANIAQNPGEPKFRRIRLGNAAFKARVACLPASLDFLATLGFVTDASGECLELPPEAAANAQLLNAAGEVLTGAISNPLFGVL